MAHLGRWRIASFVFLFVYCGACSAERKTMSYIELTPEERKVLSDISAFNQGPGKDGWRLTERLVREPKWKGIQVNRATLEKLRIEGGTAVNSTWTDCVFREVEWVSIDWSHATFTRCRFERCTVLAARGDSVQLNDCSFVDSSLEKLDWDEALITGLRCSGCHGTETYFGGGQWTDARLSNGSWNALSLMKVKVSALLIQNVKLSDLAFGAQIEGRNVVITGGEIATASFGTGRIDEMRIEQCKLGQIKFANWNTPGLRLVNCPELDRLSFLRCEMEDLTVSDIPKVGELVFVRSILTRPRLSKLTIQKFGTFESKVRSGEFNDLRVLLGADLVRAEWDDVIWNGGSLDGEVGLGGAKMKKLRLQGITYGAKYRLLEAPANLYEGQTDRWR